MMFQGHTLITLMLWLFLLGTAYPALSEEPAPTKVIQINMPNGNKHKIHVPAGMTDEEIQKADFSALILQAERDKSNAEREQAMQAYQPLRETNPDWIGMAVRTMLIGGMVYLFFYSKRGRAYRAQRAARTPSRDEYKQEWRNLGKRFINAGEWLLKYRRPVAIALLVGIVFSFIGLAIFWSRTSFSSYWHYMFEGRQWDLSWFGGGAVIGLLYSYLKKP